jgi:hypothetical protein
MRAHAIRTFVIVAAAAATLMLANASAQAPTGKPAPPKRPAPRLPDGKPNLGLTPGGKGYWGGGDGPLVQGANFGDLKAIPFQPWAQGLFEYRNATLAKDDPYPKCVPHGGPRQFAAANGFQILQMHDVQRVYIISGGAARSWRVIFMDGRPHPDIHSDEFNPGYFGHSVGRWEGDTLVVDTVGFNEKMWLLGREGMPTTDALHLIERFSRPDFNTLRYEPTIDDPGAYTKPWSGGWNLRWNDQDMEEYFCQDNERDSHQLMGTESLAK